jgi:hypothetical protein
MYRNLPEIMGDAPSARRTTESASNNRDEQHPQYGSNSAQQPNYQYQNQYTQQNASTIRSEPFNLTQLAGALPNFQDFNGQRYPSSSSAANYSIHNTHTFASSPASSQGHNIGYSNAFSGQFPGQYANSHGVPNQNVQVGGSGGPMYYNSSGYGTHAQQHAQNYYISQGQYVPQSPVFPVVTQGQQYAGRGMFAGAMQQNQQRNRDQAYGQQGRSSSIGMVFGNPVLPAIVLNVAASSSSSVVRGPPRKPRQSGTSSSIMIMDSSC